MTNKKNQTTPSSETYLDGNGAPVSGSVNEYGFTCMHIPPEIRTEILGHVVTQATLDKVSTCYPDHPTAGKVGPLLVVASIADAVLRAAQVAGAVYSYTGGALSLQRNDDNEVVLLYAPEVYAVHTGNEFDDSDGINLNQVVEDLLVEELENGAYIPTKLAVMVAVKVDEALITHDYKALLDWANTTLARNILGSRVGFDLLTLPMTAKQFGMDFEPTVEFMDGIADYAQQVNEDASEDDADDSDDGESCPTCGATEGEPCGMLDDSEDEEAEGLVFKTVDPDTDPDLPEELKQAIANLRGSIPGLNISVRKAEVNSAQVESKGSLGDLLSRIFKGAGQA